MTLIAKAIRISLAKFHYNRLTIVQDIQDYASLVFWHAVYNNVAESRGKQAHRLVTPLKLFASRQVDVNQLLLFCCLTRKFLLD